MSPCTIQWLITSPPPPPPPQADLWNKIEETCAKVVFLNFSFYIGEGGGGGALQVTQS